MHLYQLSVIANEKNRWGNRGTGLGLITTADRDIIQRSLKEEGYRLSSTIPESYTNGKLTVSFCIEKKIDLNEACDALDRAIQRAEKEST